GAGAGVLGHLQVHGDPEGRLMGGGVVRHHHRDRELLEPFPGEADAELDPRLPGDEVDLLGRDRLRGGDEVALVLPLLVVDDDDHLAGGDVCEGVLDGGESHCSPLTLSGTLRGASGTRSPRRDSTYLARISTSRLTTSPGTLECSVVALSVCGMSATLKAPSCTPATVRLTPSTATDPFSTR